MHSAVTQNNWMHWIHWIHWMHRMHWMHPHRPPRRWRIARNGRWALGGRQSQLHVALWLKTQCLAEGPGITERVGEGAKLNERWRKMKEGNRSNERTRVQHFRTLCFLHNVFQISKTRAKSKDYISTQDKNQVEVSQDESARRYRTWQVWAVVANCKVASFAKLNEMILLRSKRSQLVAGDPRSRRRLEFLDQASSAEGNWFCSMENRERERGGLIGFQQTRSWTCRTFGAQMRVRCGDKRWLEMGGSRSWGWWKVSISPHRPASSITVYSGLNYIKWLLFATRGASVYLVAEQMYMLCLATPISRHQHACIHAFVIYLHASSIFCALLHLRIIAYQCAHTHLPACIMRAAGLCVLHDPTFMSIPY